MWQKIPIGTARRVTLDDGTIAVAVLQNSPEGEQALFFSDTADLDLLEFESEKLGTLSDIIDVLQPEDIIDICCRMQRT